MVSEIPPAFIRIRRDTSLINLYSIVEIDYVRPYLKEPMGFELTTPEDFNDTNLLAKIIVDSIFRREGYGQTVAVVVRNKVLPTPEQARELAVAVRVNIDLDNGTNNIPASFFLFQVSSLGIGDTKQGFINAFVRRISLGNVTFDENEVATDDGTLGDDNKLPTTILGEEGQELAEDVGEVIEGTVTGAVEAAEAAAEAARDVLSGAEKILKDALDLIFWVLIVLGGAIIVILIGFLFLRLEELKRQAVVS